MIYNPWRVVVQLLGGLVVLAWVDWRFLLGVVAARPGGLLGRPALEPRSCGRSAAMGPRSSGRRSTPRRPRRSAACGWSAPSAGSTPRRPGSSARATCWPGWSCSPGGGPGPSRSSGTCCCRPPRPGSCSTAAGRSSQGRLSLGDLMMFLVYLAMLLEPIAVLATSMTQLQNNLSGFDRVLDLLAEPREMAVAPRHDPGPQGAGRRAGSRSRASASATRGRSATVLRDIDLDVEPGETIALVGRSGAGKTTLCNLIARFYDPTAGADPARRRRPPRDRRRELPPPARDRRAGRLPVRRHGRREHRLRRPPGRPLGGSSRPPRPANAASSSRPCPTATTPSSASAGSASAAASGSGWRSPAPCWPTP